MLKTVRFETEVKRRSVEPTVRKVEAEARKLEAEALKAEAEARSALMRAATSEAQLRLLESLQNAKVIFIQEENGLRIVPLPQGMNLLELVDD